MRFLDVKLHYNNNNISNPFKEDNNKENGTDGAYIPNNPFGSNINMFNNNVNKSSNIFLNKEAFIQDNSNRLFCFKAQNNQKESINNLFNNKDGLITFEDMINTNKNIFPNNNINKEEEQNNISNNRPNNYSNNIKLFNNIVDNFESIKIRNIDSLNDINSPDIKADKQHCNYRNVNNNFAYETSVKKFNNNNANNVDNDRNINYDFAFGTCTPKCNNRNTINYLGFVTEQQKNINKNFQICNVSRFNYDVKIY